MKDFLRGISTTRVMIFSSAFLCLFVCFLIPKILKQKQINKKKKHLLERLPSLPYSNPDSLGVTAYHATNTLGHLGFNEPASESLL